MREEQEARAALHTLTTEQLKRGMRAFPKGCWYFTAEPVDGSNCHCFITLACTESPTALDKLREEPVWYRLEAVYEEWTARGGWNGSSEWLRLECVRELAERGSHQEGRLHHDWALVGAAHAAGRGSAVDDEACTVHAAIGTDGR